MARKTLKGSGLGGADAGNSRVPFLVFLGIFCAFGAFVIIRIRADGGADSSASTFSSFGFDLIVKTVVIAAIIVVPLLFLRWVARAGRGVAGLRTWAARNGWEFTFDPSMAAHWATRFHFSVADLTTPGVAARGRVHGRDAMILFCGVGSEDSKRPVTVIVVDADADYPVTAVVRPRSESALSLAYGSAVPLESFEFERRWRAMGRDSAGSHAVFTPRVIERLLGPMPGGQPEIVWDGPGIRAADAGFIAEPRHLESRLLLLADLAGLTPAYQVTHTYDDPSLRPYVPPPSFRFTFTLSDGAELLKALGVLTWWVGLMLLFSPLHEKWVVAVIAVVGLALFLSGVRMERLGKARRVSEWHAAQAPPLGPPPTEQPPAP